MDEPFLYLFLNSRYYNSKFKSMRFLVGIWCLVLGAWDFTIVQLAYHLRRNNP